ncbi:MAG: PLP-dependent aminotransferase family protein [Myxococcota bacterium]
MPRAVPSWSWRPHLAGAASDPLFLRLVAAVVADVRSGRLEPGQALPGTRSVARDLGINRNTVVAAWRELTSQGWIEARPGGHTRVAPVPASLEPVTRRAAQAGFDAPTRPRLDYGPHWGPSVLPLSGGRPDLSHLPVRELARAWRSAVDHTRGRILGYGDPQGHPRLRAALTSWLAAERGLRIEANDLLVTRGSQQAFDLVARALFRPGDRVGVEEYGYPLAWAAFTQAGAELVPLTVDDQGLCLDSLDQALAAGPLRAIYLTPHHQYPTMVTLPVSRRLAVLDRARAHRFAVLEDDYDNEFHFEGRPVPPMATLDDAGVVIYISTLSKTLAPGLRVGLITAAPPVPEHLVQLRVVADRQGDLATEYALAMLVEDGTLPRHLRRMRRLYASRQQHLVTELRTHLSERLAFEVPSGGLALWARDRNDDADAWVARGEELGVGVETGRRFHRSRAASPWLRLGFASLDSSQLTEAVQRLERASQ